MSPNNRNQKYINQNLTEVKEDRNNSIIVVKF